MSNVVEQNTLKRRGVGLRACNLEHAYPGFTLFAPVSEQNRTVYLIDLQGEVVHTWQLPYAPGLSGYLTERGTLLYNGRTVSRGRSLSGAVDASAEVHRPVASSLRYQTAQSLPVHKGQSYPGAHPPMNVGEFSTRSRPRSETTHAPTDPRIWQRLTEAIVGRDPAHDELDLAASPRRHVASSRGLTQSVNSCGNRAIMTALTAT